MLAKQGDSFGNLKFKSFKEDANFDQIFGTLESNFQDLILPVVDQQIEKWSARTQIGSNKSQKRRQGFLEQIEETLEDE